jgi:hypothetical protein
MWSRIVCWNFIEVTEEFTASIFRVKDEVKEEEPLRNVC